MCIIPFLIRQPKKLLFHNEFFENDFEDARKNTKKAAEKMIQRSRWKNDANNFKTGDLVLYNVDVDNNIKKRKRVLDSHLDRNLYKISKIDYKNKLVDIVNEKGNERKNIFFSRVRKFNKK